MSRIVTAGIAKGKDDGRLGPRRASSRFTFSRFTLGSTPFPFPAGLHTLHPMSAKIIDGAALAASIREEVGGRVARLGERGRAVSLTAILVGSTPAGELYAERQRQACEAVGINYKLRT